MELIWDGKYDKDGKRVPPLRVSLPFQTVETVNESVQQRQTSITAMLNGQDSEWRNRLIWGDKKYVLPSLLDEFAGKVNLIYIDPPFNVGADFSFTATIPDNPETEEDETTTFVKEPSIIEMKAYRDTWGKGLDSYLRWFFETVSLLRELLSDTGSIYIHLDWHIGQYAKVVLDEVYGKEYMINEIIWYYENKLGTGGDVFDSHHDTLYVYGKSPVHTHNPQMRPVKVQKPQPVTQKIEGERVWLRDEKGKRIYQMSSEERRIGDVWQIPIINPVANERLGYATQKPEALLERILNASSNEGDLVLDCFVGSGTTAAVAERLNRRWVVCDMGRFAVHTTRKRLLSVEHVRPFVIQNMGKYERQAWQNLKFGEGVENVSLAYRKFVLDLYKAKPITGYNWLHGLKAGRMVHVGVSVSICGWWFW